MTYTYHDVKQLKNKHHRDEEINTTQIRKLEKYVKRKKKVTQIHNQKWSRKQLMKAERFLQKLKKEKNMTIKVKHQ